MYSLSNDDRLTLLFIQVGTLFKCLSVTNGLIKERLGGSLTVDADIARARQYFSGPGLQEKE